MTAPEDTTIDVLYRPATKRYRYRARCTCGWKDKWRDTHSDSNSMRRGHQLAHITGEITAAMETEG